MGRRAWVRCGAKPRPRQLETRAAWVSEVAISGRSKTLSFGPYDGRRDIGTSLTIFLVLLWRWSNEFEEKKVLVPGYALSLKPAY